MENSKNYPADGDNKLRLNQKNLGGRTTLMNACLINDSAYIEYLLSDNDHEVGLNEKDDLGQTALFSAAAMGHSKIVKILLQEDSLDVNLQDNKGTTPLLIAIGNDNLSVVKLLLKDSRTNCNLSNFNKITPLILACAQKNNPVALLLLQKKSSQPPININAQDMLGNTALMIAATQKDPIIAAALLSYSPCKIDINLQNFSGNTALHDASYYNNHNLLKLLCKHPDVAVNTVNDAGYTARDFALISNNQECLRILDAHPRIIQQPINNKVKSMYLSVAASALKAIRSQASNLADGNLNQFHYCVATYSNICLRFMDLAEQEHSRLLAHKSDKPPTVIMSQTLPNQAKEDSCSKPKA